MAFATRTLRDTDSAITVIMDIDNDTAADNTGLDGSGIGAFANGAKVDIRRIWWALTQGTAAGNTGDVLLEFKGASSDTAAFRCVGTGHYDGSAGLITASATNTTATSADIEVVTRGTSGTIILECKKASGWTG
mgnify:FL=1|tara:strand:+ start:4323 stop:4724 length:402 start_codon:yes stop_codon:yes gene_type:complete